MKCQLLAKAIRLALLLASSGSLATGVLHAQQHYIDSLEVLLQEMGQDTHRVNVLNDLAFHLVASDPLAGWDRSREALHLARQLQFMRGITKAHYVGAYALMQAGRYEEALEEAITCRDMSIQAGLTYRLPAAWTLIGSIYRTMGWHQEALDALQSAVALTEEWGDSLDLAYAWSNLATSYIDLNQDAAARELLLEAGGIFERKGIESAVVDTWINLGGTDLALEEKVDLLQRAVQKAQALDYPLGLAYAWHNLGACYLDSLGQVERAIAALAKAVHFSQQTGDLFEETAATIDLGSSYLQVGRLDSAAWHLERGLELARAQGNIQRQADALALLAELYARQGNYADAYTLQETRIALLDSLFDEQLTEKLAEANARYEARKKEARIAAQQLEIERQRHARNLVIGIALLALLLMGFLWQRRYYRQRREKEQAELEARLLRQVAEQKTSFFSYLAHELRTPLTLILGPLEEALNLLRQSNLERPLKTSHRQAQHLLVLVNQILDMVRHDASLLEVHRRPVELASFFTILYESFAPTAKKKKIELEWLIHLPPEKVFVVDVEKLRHIMYNLLSNALKFTPSGGRVSVVAWQDASTLLTVEVSDTGPGIDEKEQARIFDRYYQTKEGQGSGTGLGLAWAAELAELLGGRLDVASRPGAGATFRLQIPIESVRQEVSPAADAEPTSPNRQEVQQWDADYVPRVLVVEDNPEMSEFIRHLLDPPMVVHQAFHGKEALQWLEQNEPPDLIISDVMMPQMDGFELRNVLKNHVRWKNIPFIFLTASGAEQDVLRGFALGVDDYVVKPFHPAELVARVQNALWRSQRRRHFADVSAAGHEPETDVSADVTLLRRAEQVVLAQLDKPGFKVSDLAEALNYSRRQLSRIIGKLAGMSPVEFILEIRLQKAMELLRTGKYATVAEVRYAVGIESASYFTTKFRKRFGVSPSEVLAVAGKKGAPNPSSDIPLKFRGKV